MADSRDSTGYNDPSELESRIDFYQQYGQRRSENDWYPWVADKIALSENDRVLEIGCGTGNLWRQGDWDPVLAKRVVLSDISTEMVQKCQDELSGDFPNFDFMCLNVHSIPFEDESFDVVIANHVLHLVDNLGLSLSEIKRVLENGGKFYATTKYKHNFGGIDSILQTIGLDESINEINKFQINEAGRILSYIFDSVKEELFKEVYNITEDDIDALVYFADSKIGLERQEKDKLANMLRRQMQQRQGERSEEYTIAMEKYMGLLTARK